MKNTHGSYSNQPIGKILTAPAYPFSTRDLLGGLGTQLTQELQRPMTLDAVGRLMGRSRSTTHRWLNASGQSQITAYMCLLERLSPARRHAFIDCFCRVCPGLEHPRLAHSPATVGKLLRLLEQPKGLSILTGPEPYRNLVANALGHEQSLRTGKRPSIAGLDFHLPRNFVPVVGVHYVDGALGIKRVGEMAAEILPRILASAAPVLLFNGVWSAVPAWRKEILNCARHKHVILVEAGTPPLKELDGFVRIPINIVTVLSTKCVPDGIRVTCRRLNHRDCEQR